MLNLADIVLGYAATDAEVVNKEPHEIIMAMRNLIGDPSTRDGQGDIASLDVRHQAKVGQALNCSCDRRQSGAQLGGDIGYAHPHAFLLKAKDDFNIILLAGGQHGCFLILR